MVKSQNNFRIINIVLALIIVLMLVFSGPAGAVIAQLDMSNMSGKIVGQSGSFYFTVTIGGNERIPIANFALEGLPHISGSPDGILEFDISDVGTTQGANITRGNYNIKLDSVHGLVYGSSGYGYGSNYDNEPYSGYGYGYGYSFIGHGYGYGYGSSSPGPDEYTKLVYLITVDTTGADAGDYNVVGKVKTGQSVKPYFSTSTTSFTLEEYPFGSISGTITDNSTGVPINNANVSAFNDATGELNITTYSNPDGTYIISSIAEGNYTLKASAANYDSGTRTVVVKAGELNSNCDIELSPEKVTLSLKSGEIANKIAVKGNATIYNFTITNEGTGANYTIENSTTNGEVKINGTSADTTSYIELSDGASSEFNVSINSTTAGYYPVTITVTNSTTEKSASLTLFTAMREISGNTSINSDATGGNASGGAVLVNSTIDSGASVDCSTIQNTTVSGSKTIVNDGSTVVHGNIIQNATITGSSIILHSNITGDSSVVSSESTVDKSNVDNSTVSGSKIVNSTITGSSVTGVTIDTGHNIALTDATVTASSGKPMIKGDGAEVITRGVIFSDIYEDKLIENLVKSQSDDTDTNINTLTQINEANKVGCDLDVTTNESTSIKISRTGINPDGGDTDDVTHSSVLSDFLHIQCSNENAVNNATVRIYYDSSIEDYESVSIYYYNKATSTWDKLTTTSVTASGRTYYETQELDHLSTFTLLGTTDAPTPTPTTPSSSGGGGSKKLTPTPTPAITSTATPKEIVAQTATPIIDDKPTPPPEKEEKKGFLGLPGFTIFFAIAGMLAVSYLIMRKKR